ncbi:hypothetical protein BaRGS_00004281, partial [Batillaria attramentaria]
TRLTKQLAQGSSVQPSSSPSSSDSAKSFRGAGLLQCPGQLQRATGGNNGQDGGESGGYVGNSQERKFANAFSCKLCLPSRGEVPPTLGSTPLDSAHSCNRKQVNSADFQQ